MDTKSRASTRYRRNNKPINKAKNRYFYLDGKLHRIIVVDRGGDMAYTWSYPDRARVGYIWSDLKRRKEPSFSLEDTAQLIGRHQRNIWNKMREGKIPSPQKTYSLDGQFRKGYYKFSVKDVMAVHDYYLTIPRGRPRKDGIIVPKAMPTKAEIMAMIKNETVLYTKDKDRGFVPIWRERDW